MSSEKSANSFKCKVCNRRASPGSKLSLTCRTCKAIVHIKCAKAEQVHPNCDVGQSLCNECRKSTCKEACALPKKFEEKEVLNLIYQLEAKFMNIVNELRSEIRRLKENYPLPPEKRPGAAATAASMDLEAAQPAKPPVEEAARPTSSQPAAVRPGMAKGVQGRRGRKNDQKTDKKEKGREQLPSKPKGREKADCLYQRLGRCRYGDFCRKRHRAICENFSSFGQHQEKGCVKGPECTFMHPIACRSALARGICKNNACADFHPGNTVFMHRVIRPQKDFRWGARPANMAATPPPHPWFNFPRIPPPPWHPPPSQRMPPCPPLLH